MLLLALAARGALAAGLASSSTRSPGGSRERAATRVVAGAGGSPRALADGWRFAGLHAADGGGAACGRSSSRRRRRPALETVAGRRAARCRRSSTSRRRPAGTSARRTTSTASASTGHEPLRPLVDHDLDLGTLDRPGRAAHDAYQVAVGPIHAGVIESGHFRFHVVGDRILHLDAGSSTSTAASSGPPRARRSTRACASPRAPARPARSRTASPTRTPARRRSACARRPSSRAPARSCSSSSAPGTTSTTSPPSAPASGSPPATPPSPRSTERARRLNAELTGHRFLFGTVAVGGSELDLDRRQAVAHARAELAAPRRRRAAAGASCSSTRSFQDRLPGVGVARRATTRSASARSGPPRAPPGVAERRPQRRSPRLAYDGLRAASSRERAAGDVQARLEQRALELRQSLRAARRAARRGPLAPAARRAPAGRRARDRRRPRREPARRDELHRRARRRPRRAPPAAHRLVRQLAGVAHAAAGNLLPDFPLINKSFELCYACADR